MTCQSKGIKISEILRRVVIVTARQKKKSELTKLRHITKQITLLLKKTSHVEKKDLRQIAKFPVFASLIPEIYC